MTTPKKEIVEVRLPRKVIKHLQGIADLSGAPLNVVCSVALATYLKAS